MPLWVVLFVTFPDAPPAAFVAAPDASFALFFSSFATVWLAALTTRTESSPTSSMRVMSAGA